MPDRWERRHGLRVGVRDARRDADHGGLRNLGEFRLSTDPQDEDSDGDWMDADGVTHAFVPADLTDDTARRAPLSV
jgi:hypothetical protein